MHIKPHGPLSFVWKGNNITLQITLITHLRFGYETCLSKLFLHLWPLTGPDGSFSFEFQGPSHEKQEKSVESVESLNQSLLPRKWPKGKRESFVPLLPCPDLVFYNGMEGDKDLWNIGGIGTFDCQFFEKPLPSWKTWSSPLSDLSQPLRGLRMNVCLSMYHVGLSVSELWKAWNSFLGSLRGLKKALMGLESKSKYRVSFKLHCIAFFLPHAPPLIASYLASLVARSLAIKLNHFECLIIWDCFFPTRMNIVDSPGDKREGNFTLTSTLLHGGLEEPKIGT